VSSGPENLVSGTAGGGRRDRTGKNARGEIEKERPWSVRERKAQYRHSAGAIRLPRDLVKGPQGEKRFPYTQERTTKRRSSKSIENKKKGKSNLGTVRGPGEGKAQVYAKKVLW